MFDSFIDTVGKVTRTGIIQFDLVRHFSNLEHIDDATNAVTGLDSGSCKTLTKVKHEIHLRACHRNRPGYHQVYGGE